MQKIPFLTISASLIFMAFPFLLKAQVPGYGLVFDGDDDYVNVLTTSSDELNPVENLTLECWVYLLEAPSDSHIPHLISRFNCYSLSIESDGRPRAYMHNDEGEWFLQSGTTTITTNHWYHLAATYDGSHMRIFVNGRLEGTTAVRDTMARTTNNFRIGARNAYVTNTNTIGIIDEARVWDIPRTEAEIQATMNRTIPGNTPGLVGYWRFDEGSGTYTDDETSYHNDGTLMHMSLSAAWITSTALIGEASLFAESEDISETYDCTVDVDFMADDGSGSGYSLAVMQVNEPPNNVTGLYEDRAGLYWEIWSEDPDFDGNFTVDVRFHYDIIDGLPSESSLELYRRDDAASAWNPVTGYTVVTGDGGSSATNDGLGYIELTITEAIAGGFSGQYIISWTNEPPVVGDIQDQSVQEGSSFATIDLDDYVDDPDNPDDEITWTVSGENDVTVVISDRVATIIVNDPEWNGSETITFTAEDPDGESDADQVTFTVTFVNDAPMVAGIPNQVIDEGGSFTPISLDDYVTDVDDADSILSWTVITDSNLSVGISDHMANISVVDPEWNGTDVLYFVVQDAGGLHDTERVSFSVNFVNDLPVVSDISDQTIAEGQHFRQINLDDFVLDVDDPDSLIMWTVQGDDHMKVTIENRMATITIADPQWNGSDTLIFTATDTAGLFDLDTSIWTVSGMNDAPTLGMPVPDTSADAGQAFSFVLDPNTFKDIDPGDCLVLSASIYEEGMTPAWITFDPVSGTFSGTPADENSGMVEVILTATDDSAASVTDTFTIKVISYVGISHPLTGLEINLYPNPSTGRFVIESDWFGLRDVVLEIFNEKGQLVWHRKIMDDAGILRESVDLDKAADGLYILRLRNKSGLINKRFLITR